MTLHDLTLLYLLDDFLLSVVEPALQQTPLRTAFPRAVMMDSSEVVIPRKIGACAATRAVVLLYTDAGGTKIRKRIMPIRTLGWLGVAACARSLVGSHSRYLAGVPIDQIEELVNKLLAPIQIEANAFVSSSAQLHLSEGSEDEDQTIWPAHVQMSEPASTTALPRADAIETGTPPHAIATKDPESENVVEFEDEELQGDDALLELFMRCDVFEPAEKPPCPATPVPFTPRKVTVSFTPFEQECGEKDALIDTCSSPSSVLDLLPLIQRHAHAAIAV